VVELSQPEVHFAAPCNQGGGCQKQPCCQGRGKTSLVSINISKVRGGFFGSGGLGAAAVPQAVTSVVPAFATATIPIALQTTQFAVGTQSALFGAAQQSAALTRGDIESIVRQAFEREAAEREAAQRQAAQRQGGERDPCADLKARVEKIETRLGEIEKQVQRISTKLKVVP